MDKLMNIGEAAERLGISPTTLRRWEQSGKLIPERTQGNQRRYRLSQIEPVA
jgi:excisionase family DNA binding protein